MKASDEAERLRLFGTSEDVRPPRLLTAGDLSCELSDGALRYVTWRGVEVIRGIAYLLRDADWGTATMHLQTCQVRQVATGFEVSLQAVLGEGTSAVAMQGIIRGSNDGTLDFRVSAQGAQPVVTSRCGFVLLHPAAVAGKELEVTHTDASHEKTTFPLLVSPVQPVLDIRRLRHAAAPGVWVDCLLEAELPHDPHGKFEMEDQRNWSDASFKTYVASLLDPWPYTLPAGRSFSQRVRVRIEDAQAGTAPSLSPCSHAALQLGDPVGRMPAIGVAAPDGLASASPEEKAAVGRMHPQWLLGEVDLTDPSPESGAAAARQLRALFDLADEAGARIQLDFVCSHRPEFDAAVARELCGSIGRWPAAVRALPAPLLKSFQPQGKWPELPPLESYSAAFRDAFPGAALGGGMFTNFTELNRKRSSAECLDFIGHAVCPIVHAADDRSVMGTLESLPHIVRSVHAHWPGLSYRLGPVTLAMHRNPYGERPVRNSERRRLPMGDEDPRHQGSFNAAWTAGVAAAAIPSGVDVLYLHHTHGVSGPLLDPGQPGWTRGSCVPAYRVQAALTAAAGAPLLDLRGLPAGLCGLAWQHSGEPEQLLIANRTVRAMRVEVPGFTAQDLGDPLAQAKDALGLEIAPYACWLLGRRQ